MTPWTEVLGWTLVHFVWQGAAIAVLAAIALRLLRPARPQTRYALACLALAMMLASPIVTAIAVNAGPRARLLPESVHLLRSPRGAVIGVALTPQQPAATTTSSSVAPARPMEMTLPFELDTAALFPLIVTVWLAGVAVLLIRLAAGCWRIRALHAAALREPESRWNVLAEKLAERLHLPRRFSVVDSVRVTTPTVIGWLRPVVLLPVAALAALTPRQVEAIVAHELAHIRRHDFAVNLLQTIAETVLFYHPAVWWLSSRIRTEREHCCDDVAVAVCGDAAEYAAALTALASWSVAHAPLAMAATRGSLVTRVRRLLHLPEPVERSTRRTALAVAVVLVSVVAVGILGAMVKAQPLALAAGGFGPPQLNLALGFELFPMPATLPTDDPRGVRGWGLQLSAENGTAMTFVGFSARGLIRQAYDLGVMPIVGAPRWMDEETFDLSVAANLRLVDGRPDDAEVQAALRQLFEERLGLVAHRETRAFPAYALTRARADGSLGPNIVPSGTECFRIPPAKRDDPPPMLPPGLQSRSAGRPVPICGVDNHFMGLRGVGATMADLLDEFRPDRHPIGPDREVVDRTGLDGAYDFDLRFGLLPIAAIAHAHPKVGMVLQPFGFRNVFTALPEQLGLKLVDTTITHEVLVIDQINRP